MTRKLQMHRWFVNSLPVIYCQMPFCGTVYAGYYASAGSYADGTQHGLAHCVEHMLFNHTRDHTTQELHTAIGLIGANSSACTGPYMANYGMEVIPDNLSKALTLLHEMMWTPVFVPSEWRKEKAVILEELRGTRDNPFNQFFDKADDALFNSQVGHVVSGTVKQIRSYKIDDVEAFYKRNYGYNTSCLVIVGSLPAEVVLATCRKTLESFDIHAGQLAPVEKSIVREDTNVIFTRKSLAQCYIIEVLRGPPLSTGGNVGFFCALDALGGDIWSLLFQRVRERLGACYSIRAFPHHVNQHEGTAVIYSECGPRNRVKVIQGINDCVEEMRKGNLTHDMCQSARAANELEMTGVLNNPERAGDIIGRKALFGIDTDIEASIENVHKLTDDDIREAASKWCGHVVARAVMKP